MGDARLVSFFEKRVERSRLVSSILVDDEVVENVIEKGFHELDLAAFDEVDPCLHECVLDQIFAHGAIARFEKSIHIKTPLICAMRHSEHCLPLHLLFRSHHIEAEWMGISLQKHYNVTLKAASGVGRFHYMRITATEEEYMNISIIARDGSHGHCNVSGGRTSPVNMEINKKNTGKNLKSVGTDFVERFWEDSWTYIKTVVDVMREPILILDKDFHVMAANEPFYQTFQVEPKDTETRLVYELGDGQWNIPSLRKLLEDILPKNTFFKGFEVAHDFPSIGRKVMILNARQIHFKESAAFQPIILLAIEDVSEMMAVAEKLANHTNQFEMKMIDRTLKLETLVAKLEKEIEDMKKKPL